MDGSLPGSSVHGVFPGKNTGMGLPFPFPGDLRDARIKPRSPALQADSLLSELVPKHIKLKTKAWRHGRATKGLRINSPRGSYWGATGFSLSSHLFIPQCPPPTPKISSSLPQTAALSLLTHHRIAGYSSKISIVIRLVQFSSSALRKTMCHSYSNLEEITCSSTLLHRFFSDIFILNKSSMGREFCASTMFLPRKNNLAFHLRTWTHTFNTQIYVSKLFSMI